MNWLNGNLTSLSNLYQKSLTILKLIFMGCVSEIKISHKNRVTSSNLNKISSSSDAAEILFKSRDNDTYELHELVKIMLLTNSNTIIIL